MNAHSVVFERPKGGHHINLQQPKVSKSSLSVTEAMTMFGTLEISCSDPACGWHGKASRTKFKSRLSIGYSLQPPPIASQVPEKSAFRKVRFPADGGPSMSLGMNRIPGFPGHFQAE